jgi:hypothetical protein
MHMATIDYDAPPTDFIVERAKKIGLRLNWMCGTMNVSRSVIFIRLG